MLLALDLGTHTGWALFSRGERLASGTWLLGKDRTRDRGDEFLMRVQSLVQSHGVKVIAHEHVPSIHQHASADAAHLFGGWLMLLAMISRRTTAKVVRIETPEVYAASGVRRDGRRAPKGASEADRKHLAGERRENNKALVIAAAAARGWIVGDDNEADALFVGVAALAQGACS